MGKFLVLFIFSVILTVTTNQAFGQSDDKLAVLETTQGKMVIEFFPEDAPNHVANFINLTNSGFYDGVLFHRIIPGFMIQGGDPNTKTNDTSTWGIGGPGYSIDAEFNDIKHNRGIVSMARAQDPNSAGSQFFIVHQNSTFLDQQYTVFGRLATDESFETLDKIASLETGQRDIPVNPDDAKITKATIVNRSEVPDLLDLGEPERVTSSMDNTTQPLESTGNRLFESKDLDVSFSAPEGWFMQQPEKVDENTPDVVVVGPKTGAINPVISLKVADKDGKTFDEFIKERNDLLQQVVSAGNLQIISQEKSKVDGQDAYVTDATGIFKSGDASFDVKFKEISIDGNEKFYTFAYSNGIDDFDNHLPNFNDSIDTFKILSEPKQEETQKDQGGGCLIATATFGSEFAPQVQQLRELRDNTILSTKSGTAFMTGFNQIYYSFSPAIADLERENPIFKEMVRVTITPMLSSLSLLNFVNIDSEDEMLGYGISIIMLNLGMYFIAPAITINQVRKKIS